MSNRFTNASGPDAAHRWVSPAEAARIFDVHVDTIRRRIADGTLEGRRFGPRLIRVKVSE